MADGSSNFVNWGKEAERSKASVELQNQLGSPPPSKTIPQLEFLMKFPGDISTLQNMHACIVHVWKEVGPRFKSYWQTLSDDLRRDFIKTFSPHISQSVSTPPSRLFDLLMPDFTLDALVPDKTYTDRIEHWATTEEFEDVLFEDIDYAFALYKQFPQVLMQDPRFNPSDFTFTSPSDWKTYKVNDLKAFMSSPVYKMMQEGQVLTGNTFWTAANRFFMQKSLVISMLWEYQRDILKEPWTFKATSTGASETRCQKCGSTDNLKSCSRCKLVKYCSRECQIADWKVHKPSCNPAK